LLPLCLPLEIRADDAEQEIELKTGFLTKFIQYVHWPESPTATEQDAPIRIAVIGESPYLQALQKLAGAEKQSPHYQVEQKAVGDSLAGFNVVMIPAMSDEDLHQVLATLGDDPALTVGDGEGFAQAGVMINFISIKTDKGRKVRFEINNNRAHRTGLVFGAQLLKLATRVIHTKDDQ
jgi:hypothetical protein